MKAKLLKKFSAIICSAIIAGSVVTYCPILAESENLISNSTFDITSYGWGTYFTNGGKCSLSLDNKRLAVNVKSAGELTYSVQAFADDSIPLYQNGVYRVSFDISATTNRPVDFMIQQNGGTYQAYTYKQLSVTTEAQTVDYEFTMDKDTDIMTKLCFNCGYFDSELPEHTIYIDNVQVKLIDDSNVDKSGMETYEPPIVTNQIGYKPDANKKAVFVGAESDTFSVVNANTGKIVFTGELSAKTYDGFSKQEVRVGDFSCVTESGNYYVSSGNLDNSYTFEISDSVYNSALEDSIKMLYLQRCGTSVNDDIFSHKACHTSLATVYGTAEKIDVSGGWHDAGDYGRYVVTGAKTVADLLYAYDNAPELFGDNTGIPESKNNIPDILDEARYEIEWLLKMQDSNGGVHHKVSCANFCGYIMPENETEELFVTPISTTATAAFCGTMALSYEFYKDIDSNFAEKCLVSAENAYMFLEENPNFIFTNPSDIVTGSYGDNSDKDERYWAVAQMWRATGNEKYFSALEKMSVAKGMDSANFGDYGNIAIVTMKDIDTDSEVYQKAKNSLISNANLLVSASEKSAYRLSVTNYYKGGWGSNMTACNQGIILGNAYLLTGDCKYLNAAKSDLDYLFGENPLGICYYTGYGTVSPKHPHHRPSIAQNTAMKGMLVGGVHPYLEDDATKVYCKDKPTGKCYVDNQESYTTNEITIYWNSPLTYLLTFAETNSHIVGDVNADGAFNIANVVTMQKWLLAVPEAMLADWKAGDLCEDNKINVFDLCLMKRELLKMLK